VVKNEVKKLLMNKYSNWNKVSKRAIPANVLNKDLKQVKADMRQRFKVIHNYCKFIVGISLVYHYEDMLKETIL
jgi:hypothetical protein